MIHADLTVWIFKMSEFFLKKVHFRLILKKSTFQADVFEKKSIYEKFELLFIQKPPLFRI